MSHVNEDRYPLYDVLVAGGGLAGIAAAIAAARTGANTLLVERGGWLGGIGITGANGLHSFYNIFGKFPGTPPIRVVRGIAQELVDRAAALGGAVGHVPVERGADHISMFSPVEPEVFTVVAAAACAESGVRLLLHTTVEDARTADGHIEGIVVWNKAGRSLIRAKQFVDCSGDGDLAAYAGVPYEHFTADLAGAPYREYAVAKRGSYQTGYSFRLCNVDLQALEADLDGRGAIRHLAHAVKPGMTSPDVVRLDA